MTLPNSVKPVLELKISLDQLSGGISVNGPIDNPLICYAMLELAKDAVRAHNQAKVAKSSIVVPTFEFAQRQQ